MNAAALARNPKVILAAGGAGVVGLLALRNRTKSSTSSSMAVRPTPGTVADSTASDVYNSVQPLLEGLQRQIDDLGLAMTSPVAVLDPASSPLPMPYTAPPAPAPAAWVDPSPVPGYPPAPPGEQSQPVVYGDQTIGVAYVPAPNDGGLISTIINNYSGLGLSRR